MPDYSTTFNQLVETTHNGVQPIELPVEITLSDQANNTIRNLNAAAIDLAIPAAISSAEDRADQEFLDWARTIDPQGLHTFHRAVLALAIHGTNTLAYHADRGIRMEEGRTRSEILVNYNSTIHGSLVESFKNPARLKLKVIRESYTVVYNKGAVLPALLSF